MLISVEETGKNLLESGQESMGSAPVLSHCSLLKHPRINSPGVLEHSREGETNAYFSLFGVFRSDRIPKATNDFGVYFFIHSFYIR
jgi:hypothetical protein